MRGVSRYHQDSGTTKKWIGTVICVLSRQLEFGNNHIKNNYCVRIRGSPKLLRDPHVYD